MRVHLCSLVVVGALVASAWFCLIVFVPETSGAYTPRAPILITANHEFTSLNGVVSGSGHQLNPYIIEGYEIDALGGNGIEIRDTNAYFIIRDCYVHNGTYGVLLDTVSNGRIESCAVSDFEGAIAAAYSTDITVINNDASGLYGAIGLGFCSDSAVISNNCTITDEGASIETYECTRIQIEWNNVTGDRGHGLRIDSSQDVVARLNIVDGSGCLLYGSSACSLWDNTFTLSGVSIGGDDVHDFDSFDIPTNNTANGNPIHYFKNLVGGSTAALDTGQVIVANCSGFTVDDFTVADVLQAWEPWWFSGGLECYYSSNLTVSHAAITNCGNAVAVFRSPDLLISNCSLNDSYTSVYLTESHSARIESSAFVSTTVDFEGGGINVHESNSTEVVDCEFSNSIGVSIFNGLNTLIDNCTIGPISAYSYEGETRNLTVRMCEISGTGWYGIWTANTDDMLVENCTLTGFIRGFELQTSSNITIRNNTMSSNSEVGAMIHDCANLLITGNSIINNNVSGLDISGCQNVTITWNLLTGNNVGATGGGNLGLLVHHNDFVGNRRNAYMTLSSGDTWDDGYPSGGNYWSDYYGIDQFSGPGQDVPGHDGIGDTPYIIDDSYYGYKDNYPLMAPVVSLPNHVPSAICTIEPSVGNISTVFILNASASTDAEDPSSELEVRWDVGYNGSWDVDWTKDKTVEWTFTEPGTYLVLFEVRDTTLAMNDSDGVVQVRNEAPVASFVVTPVAGNVSTMFVFDASNSTDLETVTGTLEVRWDWENDGSWDTSWSTSKLATHEFSSDGVHTVALQVMDPDGLLGNITRQVVVDSVPPHAYAGQGQVVEVDTLVYFDGSGSTDNIGIANYTWRFDYGGTERTVFGVNSSWLFSEKGTYSVTLTVKDAAGQTDTDVTTIVVEAKDTSGFTLSDYWWVATMAIVAALAAVLYIVMRRRGGTS